MSRKKAPSKQRNGINTAIIVAVIGLIGTIIAAYLSFRASSKPFELAISATQTAETNLVVVSTSASTPSPTVQLETIVFWDSQNQDFLNSRFTWEPGNSLTNNYEQLSSPTSIRLIAGSQTDQWDEQDNAPKIIYSTRGNFEAVVKISFSEKSSHELCGLGIRSPFDKTIWVRFNKSHFSDGQSLGVSTSSQYESQIITRESFPVDIVYLKLQRLSSIVNAFYSVDGQNWSTAKQDIVFSLTEDVEIYLITAAWQDTGTYCDFSLFEVRSFTQ
jgi:regulation of enolase protein 1 (concanavalin A-like superfamily)